MIPDGIVLGKSLGAGFPPGAFMARPEVADTLPSSVCAYTMAGFHLACAAGIAQFDCMRQASFQRTLRKNSTAMRRCVTAPESGRRQGLRLKSFGEGMSYGIHILNEKTGAPPPAPHQKSRAAVMKRVFCCW